ncbi:MAG: hypothetical protein K6E85_10320 [Lachnospiraceae bacterium]|nr:hypothetical protein [Lachnospiraceae bacterium]
MKLDESIINQFNLNPNESREPVNTMKVADLLDFIKESSVRIVNKSELYIKTVDADVQTDCLDIVAMRLNDFVQSLIDIAIFIRKEEGSYNGKSTSLRYCITSYDTLIEDQSLVEKQFLGEVLLRNEITHDYFNRDIHQQKLISLMQNCASGALEVYAHLKQLCEEKNLLDKYVEKIRQ